MSTDIDYVEAGSGYCGKVQTCRVAPGNTYRIEPLSPNKRKNRGRLCRVTGFRHFGDKRDLYANVIWLDTGKRGWTEMGDFVQVSPVECC